MQIVKEEGGAAPLNALEESCAAGVWSPGPTGPARAPDRRSLLESSAPGLAESLQFLGSFLCHPLSVGALVPSSRRLARAVVEGCDLGNAETVVELGAGTGALTRLILEGLNPEATFLAMELDERNARGLRRRWPHLDVCQDSAARIREHLRRRGRRTADCIISALPWGNMSRSTQERILAAVFASLRPGGRFATYAYVHAQWLPGSRQFKRRLRTRFDRVSTTPIVWRNLPPAFVYHCC
jgi:phospholipid N-methyltransferase